jgi:hypothetical protein
VERVGIECCRRWQGGRVLNIDTADYLRSQMLTAEDRIANLENFVLKQAMTIIEHAARIAELEEKLREKTD